MTRLTGAWLQSDETQQVCRMLTDAGHQAYLVGGCVRNAILNEPVSDIDVSTNAQPDQVLRLAQQSGLKAIPTGIEHGTVTVLCNGVAHEITTFRKDVKTDGRRAVVAFSDDIADDARRRDFTMNALYVHADGTLVDPLGGLGDLEARHVRFIQDPARRIQEDYLRILRFFRFHAWYGDARAGLDADGLAAIAENIEGLTTLSKERVGSEMLKLLGAPDPAPSVAAMRTVGALLQVMPGADDRALAPLVHLEQISNTAPSSIRRLAALGGADLETNLRLSKRDARDVTLLREMIGAPASLAEIAYRHDAQRSFDVALLRAAVLEQPLDQDGLKALSVAAAAVFPVQAADLMPQYTGAALGARLRSLENQWIKSGFTLSKTALLLCK